MRTHDYRRDNHGKGHSCGWREPTDGGKTLRAHGWGPREDRPIEQGDYILLSHPDSEDEDVRYRVTTIRYMQNPKDQWFADLAYAPRSPEASGE